MKFIDSISLDELRTMSEKMYDELVKAVVDIKRKKVVVDGDLHADEEQLLLQDGSIQCDLWGINLYPDSYGDEDFIEFDSMINIRPSQGNRSRGVDDEDIQNEIRKIINEVVYE
jgi:hypothetical protein